MIKKDIHEQVIDYYQIQEFLEDMWPQNTLQEYAEEAGLFILLGETIRRLLDSPQILEALGLVKKSDIEYPLIYSKKIEESQSQLIAVREMRDKLLEQIKFLKNSFTYNDVEKIYTFYTSPFIESLIAKAEAQKQGENL